MSMIINLFIAIVALLAFLCCLFCKGKFSRYVGFAAIFAFIHTSIDVVEHLFCVHWTYILAGYVCVFVLVCLAYRLVKRKNADAEE